MTATARLRLVVVLLAVLALAALAGGYVLLDNRSQEDDRARVLEGSPVSDGWVRLEFNDVQVSVPSDWQRQTGGNCVPGWEHWGPTSTPACAVGVTFLPEAATMSAEGRDQAVRSRDADDPDWTGYSRTEKYVVSVSDDDSAVVERVIASVS